MTTDTYKLPIKNETLETTKYYERIERENRNPDFTGPKGILAAWRVRFTDDPVRFLRDICARRLWAGTLNANSTYLGIFVSSYVNNHPKELQTEALQRVDDALLRFLKLAISVNDPSAFSEHHSQRVHAHMFLNCFIYITMKYHPSHTTTTKINRPEYTEDREGWIRFHELHHKFPRTITWLMEEETRKRMTEVLSPFQIFGKTKDPLFRYQEMLAHFTTIITFQYQDCYGNCVTVRQN